jgi:hypothetical protein
MSGELRHRTLLTSFGSERVRSTLAAGFNERGDLVLEGYDIGSFVEEVWGDSDYEYWLTLRRADLPRLAGALAAARGEAESAEADRERWLISMLQALFAPDAAPLHFRNDSEFKTWLEEHTIPSEFSSWP